MSKTYTILCFALIFCQTHISRLPFDKGSSYISLGTPYDFNVVSVRKQLDTFLKDSAIAMHSRLSQKTLHDEVEEVA